MQGQAVQAEAFAEEAVVLALAVAHVADQRMTQVFEVAADLVPAAGLRTDFDQPVTIQHGQAAKVGDRGCSRAAVLAGNGMIDRPLLRRDPPHQRQIALPYLGSCKPLLHLASGLIIESEQQDAAGRPVEAMDGVDAPADEIADELQGHDAVPCRAPVHRQARGLVDGQQGGVAIEDREVERSAHSYNGPMAGRPVDRHLLILREQLPELAEKYHVRTLEVFGSYVRNEQTATSDLDVLVTFDEAPDLLQFIELEDRLGEILGVKVDLVMKKALKPQLEQSILSEAVPV
jgi:uncharacterized protein